MQTVFDISGMIAIAGWAVLLFTPLLPKWLFIVPAYLVPGVLCALYIGLASVFTTDIEGDFETLQGVMILFDNPQATMAGWVHYLAFDLFIAAWQVSQAEKRGIRFWMILPCLPATLYFGPAGLFLFFVICGGHHLMIQRKTIS